MEFLENVGYYDDNNIVINNLNYGKLFYINRIVYAYRQLEGSVYNSMVEIEKAVLNTQGFDIDVKLLAQKYRNDIILRYSEEIAKLYISRKRIKEYIGEDKYNKYLRLCKEISDSTCYRILAYEKINESEQKKIQEVLKVIGLKKIIKLKRKAIVKEFSRAVSKKVDKLVGKHRKILLLAYVNKNFGDDMFVKTICNYFEDRVFGSYIDSRYIGGLNVSNLVSIKRKRLNRALNRLFNFLGIKWIFDYEAVVYVVGGLFDEDNIWHAMVRREGMKDVKYNILQKSYFKNVPFFLLGCNMTRIITEEYIKQMEYIFQGLYDVCFRDVFSFNSFSYLKNVRYAPDIVFNYDYGREITCRSNTVLISVWGCLLNTDKLPQWKWAEQYWNPYERFLIEVIETFQAMNVDVVLASLCDNEGDLKACKRIEYMLPAKRGVSVINYDGNLDDMIKRFYESSFILGTRFHSIVMALNANISFYPIVYESKTEQLLKDVGYKGSKAYIDRPESYNVKEVIDAYINKNIIDCSEYKTKAKEQFSVLEHYLNKSYN